MSSLKNVFLRRRIEKVFVSEYVYKKVVLERKNYKRLHVESLSRKIISPSFLIIESNYPVNSNPLADISRKKD